MEEKNLRDSSVTPIRRILFVWRVFVLPVVTALLPGILAGTQVTGLLFFLNPHLPFDPNPVFSGVLFFGSVLGAFALLVHLPFTWGRPRRALRWLAWTLTIVLTIAGVGAWTHASHYAFYLPAGINRRLLKAATWLTLGAVICFYTAVVHQVRNRSYGRRSQVLFALTAIASIYVVMERREAFKPRLDHAPRATTFAGSPRPQLVVVGIEAATLDAILPLAEQGRLPFFSQMMTEGSYARTTALHPNRRIPAWTTLAAGKYPYQHGVVDEHVVDARFLGNREVLKLLPVGFGFKLWGTWNASRPIDARARQTLALWEILARLDITSALVGWPLTAPSTREPHGEGAAVGLSDEFFVRPEEKDTVWPPEIAERARLFRHRADEIDPERAASFGTDPPPVVLDSLAGDLWREDLSFFLLDQDPGLEAFFVVLPGLEEISASYFGGFSAVRFEGEAQPEFQQPAQLVAAYYTHLDDFLANLWKRSRQPRLLAVVSVHGVEDVYGWRKTWQFLRRQPSLHGYFERGPDGVLMLMGEGIRPGSKVLSADLVDLVPTLLYGLGFPIARDLDGAVLTGAFETSFLARRPLAFLPSYETFKAPE